MFNFFHSPIAYNVYLVYIVYKVYIHYVKEEEMHANTHRESFQGTDL